MNDAVQPESNHIDVDTLNMLKDVMEDGFTTLLETYIDDSKIRIDDLSKALAAGDADGVRRAAHSLKGSSGNLGANQMAALCLTVETKGKEEKLDGLASELEKIQLEYQVVADIMRSML